MWTRLLIYIAYYLLNLAFAKDGVAAAMTLPMLLLVLFNVAHISDRYFTFADVVHFMIYLFFVISPIQVLDHGRLGRLRPVSDAKYSTDQFLLAMLIAFLFYAAFTLVMRRLDKGRPKIRNFAIDQAKAPLILAGVVAMFVAYTLLSGGIGEVLAPRYAKKLLSPDKTSDSLAALAMACIGAITMGTMLLASMVQWRRDRILVFFLVALAILVTCCNPFNIARFVLLGAYVPLFLILFKGKIRASVFYGVAMAGVVLLFPLLNITTRHGAADFQKYRSGMFTDAFLLEFLDVYDMLVECVAYVGRNGHDYGLKMLANVVLFVPRSLWPGKPMLGGLDIGNSVVERGLYQTPNLSQFIAADAYMDFGLPGVVAAGLAMGLIIYALVYRQRKFINGHDLFAYAFVAGLPILMRGPFGAVATIFLVQCLTLFAARLVVAKEGRVRRATRVAGLGTRTHRKRQGPPPRQRQAPAPADSPGDRAGPAGRPAGPRMAGSFDA